MYKHIFVGGTFDGLHDGHTWLLTKAFESGERVIIGLTSDRFIQKFKASEPVASFSDRKSQLEHWLTQQNLISRASIMPIDDPYEPAASMPDIEALMVTPETKKRGEEINILRLQHGLPQVILIEAPLIVAQDQKPISSTRIRSGKIDSKGTLVMPEAMRDVLAQPLGKVIPNEAISAHLDTLAQEIIITVGDITTETFLAHGIIPHLAIIDLHVERQLHDTLAHVPETLLYYSMAVASGPGFISHSAHLAIAAWATHTRPTLLIVKGEEDLLTLPVIREAPLGSIVYYGQPGQGMVEVMVTEQKQQEIERILEQFTQ